MTYELYGNDMDVPTYSHFVKEVLDKIYKNLIKGNIKCQLSLTVLLYKGNPRDQSNNENQKEFDSYFDTKMQLMTQSADFNDCYLSSSLHVMELFSYV